MCENLINATTSFILILIIIVFQQHKVNIYEKRSFIHFLLIFLYTWIES